MDNDGQELTGTVGSTNPYLPICAECKHARNTRYARYAWRCGHPSFNDRDPLSGQLILPDCEANNSKGQCQLFERAKHSVFHNLVPSEGTMLAIGLVAFLVFLFGLMFWAIVKDHEKNLERMEKPANQEGRAERQ